LLPITMQMRQCNTYKCETAPIVVKHQAVWVVRDDLFPGGTKARFLGLLFSGAEEVAYASPAEGGAQVALAITASSLRKRATIFVGRRAKPHPRTPQAAKLRAKIVPVAPGHLSAVQVRAREYCARTGIRLMPFGADMPGAINLIAAAARATGIEPAEVWCAAGQACLPADLQLHGQRLAVMPCR
jgi:hypothetical protein